MIVRLDGAGVTVTDHDGDVYRLTYADGRLTGSRLAQTHRTAIAELLRVATERAAAATAAFNRA